MSLTCVNTAIEDVVIIEPSLHGDERGYFLESFNAREFAKAIDDSVTFVQDNHSRSAKGILRGLHYQIDRPQGKLVRVVNGRVFDVAVDIRRSSATLGRWVGVELTAENHRQLWIPAGFAHGFLVLSEYADFLYKATDFYAPEFERCILWNDSSLAIDWPLAGEPALSDKDAQGCSFAEAELFD